MFLVLISVMLVLYLWLNIGNLYNYVRLCLIFAKLPGPKCFPIFGLALKIAFLDETAILHFIESISNFAKSSHCVVFDRPTSLITNPSHLQLIMGSSLHITKGLEYGTLKLWLKEGLLLSTGNKWHTRRKMLTPTFHFKILEGFLPNIYRNASKLVHNILSHNNKLIDVEHFVSRCTLDIISEVAMGIALNSQDFKSTEYVEDIRSVSHLMIYREKTFWLRNKLLFDLTPTGRKLKQSIKRLEQFTEKVIFERKRTFQGAGGCARDKKNMAFLDCLLDEEIRNPGTISMNDIREEVDTFMFEGHDTTSSALIFCLLLLGLNEQVQSKAVEELTSIFGKSDRAASKEDLHNMKYLEMVIKETLRLYPSVPLLTRYLTNDLKLDDAVTIPAGSNVMIPIYNIHREPSLYEDPEKFIPERFTEENTKLRHPFSYIPFSGGPRNCIGQKFAMMVMKIILSTILRRTKFESITTKESLKMRPLLILRPDRPIIVTFTPRV